METSIVFARGLQRTRKQRSLTQAELAEAAGLSVQMVAALEQGDKAPSLATLDRLCEAMRTRASELFAAGEPRAPISSEPQERVNALLRVLPRRQQEDVVEIVVRVCKLVRRDRIR
jgi:transcriptional regulator with XRE-family HTH domain